MSLMFFGPKIRDFHGQCDIASFVACNGYPGPFGNEFKALRREPYLIFTMAGEGITKSIENRDFSSYAKQMYEAALKRRVWTGAGCLHLV